MPLPTEPSLQLWAFSFHFLDSSYEYECLVWMYVCAPAALGCQKRMLYSLKLELRMVVNHQVSAGNRTLKEQQILITSNHLFSSTLSMLIMKSVNLVLPSWIFSSENTPEPQFNIHILPIYVCVHAQDGGAHSYVIGFMQRLISGIFLSCSHYR